MNQEFFRCFTKLRLPRNESEGQAPKVTRRRARARFTCVCVPDLYTSALRRLRLAGAAWSSGERAIASANSRNLPEYIGVTRRLVFAPSRCRLLPMNLYFFCRKCFLFSKLILIFVAVYTIDIDVKIVYNYHLHNMSNCVTNTKLRYYDYKCKQKN